MASIYKVGKRWRAQVLIRGQRQGQVFDTKAEASQWALQVQAEGRKAPSSTVLLKDALGTLPWPIWAGAFVASDIRIPPVGHRPEHRGDAEARRLWSCPGSRAQRHAGESGR